MACLLYKQENGEVIEVRVKAQEVSVLLSEGYKSSPDDFNEDDPCELTDEAIKEMAEEKGIKVNRRTISSIKKDLGI